MQSAFSLKELPDIRYYGSYHEKGDQVMVTGIFFKACKQHGGETDIHGTTIQILQKGEKIPHTVSISKVIIAIFHFFWLELGLQLVRIKRSIKRRTN